MHRKQKSAGFTLIEIIISLAILAILASAFLSTFSLGYTTIFDMGQKSRAMTKAQKVIDAKDFSQLRDFGINSEETMKNTAYDPSQDGSYIGRYCVNKNAITIEQLDSSMADQSYNTVSVLIFYSNKRDYVTLTMLTALNP